jgi:4-hydroxy 2-oxovalerate aldolase
MKTPLLLDCTLRDGGYYTAWDFPPDLVENYLLAMKAAQVDFVEIGFRGIKNNCFAGPYAYSTEEHLRTLTIPDGLTFAVMVNGSDLLGESGLNAALENLFPETATMSRVGLVRLACHFHEFKPVLPAVAWLKKRGYSVGFNLMQIADRKHSEVLELARTASDWPLDVLYFADSMGSMNPNDTARIIGWLREEWSGPIGIHTHDNMGLALQNTLKAIAEGVNWIDATITGMGRGPGNARMEELLIEVDEFRENKANLVPLMALINRYFKPLKKKYNWGTNPYYYLSGKYGIHPTYIQEMLGDARYTEEDILSVIRHLRREGGKKFSFNSLDAARHFYSGKATGNWVPAEMMMGREVLILGTGEGVKNHRSALELYIKRAKPIVMALNTQETIDADLIGVRVACHPVRLLADCETHVNLPQPLITPATMLPDEIKAELAGKELLDYGLQVEAGRFAFFDTYCVIPTSLVIAYAIAVAASGRASRILLAGFDGYPAGDPRNMEMESLIRTIKLSSFSTDITSITPSTYKDLSAKSIYGM